MRFRGVRILEGFNRLVPALLREVEKGDPASAVRRILEAHRSAMEAYAAEVASFLGWALQASTGPPHRFRVQELERRLLDAIRASALPLVVELRIHPDAVVPKMEGLRVVKDASFRREQREARLVPGTDPEAIDLVAWARDGGVPILAGLLATMEPWAAASVLEWFPLDVQTAALKSLLQMKVVPPPMLRKTPEEVLASITRRLREDSPGAGLVAQILDQTAPSTRWEVLQRLSRDFPDEASLVRCLLFSFDDLLGVNDGGIQNLLKQLDTSRLALALKTAAPELREKFFRNMSRKAADLVKEEMEFMGPVRLADVEHGPRGAPAWISRSVCGRRANYFGRRMDRWSDPPTLIRHPSGGFAFP